jgi:hypothetical protein
MAKALIWIVLLTESAGDATVSDLIKKGYSVGQIEPGSSIINRVKGSDSAITLVISITCSDKDIDQVDEDLRALLSTRKTNHLFYLIKMGAQTRWSVGNVDSKTNQILTRSERIINGEDPTQ